MSYIIRAPLNVTRYVPRVQVSFHTETACYQIHPKIDVQNQITVDPTQSIVSIQTSKSLATPVGQFAITLEGDYWFHRIDSNDLVVIQMGYKGQPMDTVMVGLVDQVRRRRDPSSATVQTFITGRDFGKLLAKTLIKFYPEIGEVSATENKFFLTEDGMTALMEYFTGKEMIQGEPAVIIDTVMRFILPKLLDIRWTVYNELSQKPEPKKVELGQILRYVLEAVPFGLPLPLILNFIEYEGSVWNILERASIKPFMELFVDTRNYVESWNNEGKPMVINNTVRESSSPSKSKLPKGEGYYPSPAITFGEDRSKVCLFLRTTPFDKQDWEKLYQHDLLAEDVRDEDLGKSDHEHYNLFWAGEQIIANATQVDNLKRATPPILNEKDAKRYGLSPLEVVIEGIFQRPDDPNNIISLDKIAQVYSQKLKDWYQNNHKLLSGTMVVRGQGNYKIGQRLKRYGILREFYIEGVDQNFHYLDEWTTTLTLTRGKEIPRENGR